MEGSIEEIEKYLRTNYENFYTEDLLKIIKKNQHNTLECLGKIVELLISYYNSGYDSGREDGYDDGYGDGYDDCIEENNL